MRVTNTTNTAANTGVKIIGFGDISILPGHTVELPENVAYMYDTKTGKRKVLPAIETLAKLGQITYDTEDEKAAATLEAELVEAEAEENELTDEEKKAIAAQKRAETRARNKAAKEAAEKGE